MTVRHRTPSDNTFTPNGKLAWDEDHVGDYADVTSSEFNAVGDGIADDTAAIQAAINDGRPVYFPPGVYKTTSTINLTTAASHGQIITGSGPVAGSGAGTNKTIIRPSSAVTQAFKIDGSGISLAIQNGKFQHLTLDMTNMTDATSTIGFRQMSAYGWTYENVRVINEGSNKRAWKYETGSFTTTMLNCKGAVIELAGTSLANAVTTLTVLGCDLESIVYQYVVSLHIYGGAIQGSRNKITGSDINGLTVMGMDVEGTGTYLVMGSNVSHVHSFGNEFSGFSGTYSSGTPVDSALLDYQSGTYTVYGSNLTINGVLSGSVSQSALYRNSLANSNASTVTNQVDLRIGEGTNTNDLFIGINAGAASCGFIDNRSATDSLKLQRSGTTVLELKAAQSIFTGTIQASNKIWPGTDAAAAQTACGLYAGAGAPNNSNGANGDFYFRSDGTVAASTVIYHKEAGAWVTGI